MCRSKIERSRRQKDTQRHTLLHMALQQCVGGARSMVRGSIQRGGRTKVRWPLRGPAGCAWSPRVLGAHGVLVCRVRRCHSCAWWGYYLCSLRTHYMRPYIVGAMCPTFAGCDGPTSRERVTTRWVMNFELWVMNYSRFAAIENWVINNSIIHNCS